MSRMARAITRRTIAFMAGAFIAAGVTGFALATASGWPPVAGVHAAQDSGEEVAPDKKQDPGEKWATSDYPVNAAGQTYGSDAMASSVSEAPDLIAVVGDSGQSGFVTRDDLYGPDFATPEEALAWQDQMLTDGGVTIPVYTLEGRQIDTFTLQAGEAGSEPKGK